MELRKGQKIDLTKSNPSLNNLLIGLGWQSGQGVDLDTAAFLLGANDKVASDDDFIFYGNLKHKSGSVVHSGDNVTGGDGDAEQIYVDLSKIPTSIDNIAFTVTIYEAEERGQNFGRVHDSYIRVIDENTGNELLKFNLGENFSVETAIVAAEIYRYKDEWKFNAIGAGFKGGLAALCNNFGIDVSDTAPSTPTQSTTSSNVISTRCEPMKLDPPPSSGRKSISSSMPPSPPKRVELKKGQKVNLVKTGSTLGEIVINLNWSQPETQRSIGLLDRILGSKSDGIDLDLACLYELKNGVKGAVQALGNNFGSLNSEPYIALDGDDRTGSVASGETIRVNGKYADKIKRILIYTFIYDGVANWKEADGVVTVKCPGSPDIIVRMDEYNSNLYTCGIALLENQGDTFSVEKIVKFYRDAKGIDDEFNWGLRWKVGRKD